jgi:hypothetical protein
MISWGNKRTGRSARRERGIDVDNPRAARIEAN